MEQQDIIIKLRIKSRRNLDEAISTLGKLNDLSNVKRKLEINIKYNSEMLLIESKNTSSILRYYFDDINQLNKITEEYNLTIKSISANIIYSITYALKIIEVTLKKLNDRELRILSKNNIDRIIEFLEMDNNVEKYNLNEVIPLICKLEIDILQTEENNFIVGFRNRIIQLKRLINANK
jgi:hypothetical protein